MKTIQQSLAEATDKMFKDRLALGSYGPGTLPMAWHRLIDEVGIDYTWGILHLKGLVEIDVEYDHLSIPELFGDLYDECQASAVPGGMRTINAQKKAAYKRLDEEGQWVYSARVRDMADLDGWHDADSIGGFVGDDFIGSGYLPDMQVASLDHIADQVGAPKWRECSKDPRTRPLVFLSALALCGVGLPDNWQQTVTYERFS